HGRSNANPRPATVLDKFTRNGHIRDLCVTLEVRGELNPSSDRRPTMTKAVKPIPDGYHTLTPYIMVKGAAEAIEFYKKAFGAKELFRMPGADGKTIGHAELQIGDSRIMLADDCAEANAHSPSVLKG